MSELSEYGFKKIATHALEETIDIYLTVSQEWKNDFITEFMKEFDFYRDELESDIINKGNTMSELEKLVRSFIKSL